MATSSFQPCSICGKPKAMRELPGTEEYPIYACPTCDALEAWRFRRPPSPPETIPDSLPE